MQGHGASAGERPKRAFPIFQMSGVRQWALARFMESGGRQMPSLRKGENEKDGRCYERRLMILSNEIGQVQVLFFDAKICVCQKKAVPLHRQSVKLAKPVVMSHYPSRCKSLLFFYFGLLFHFIFWFWLTKLTFSTDCGHKICMNQIFWVILRPQTHAGVSAWMSQVREQTY